MKRNLFALLLLTTFVFQSAALAQKVEYINMNPVQAGLVEDQLEYQFSCARLWADRTVDEPLLTDHLEIDWR